MAWDASKLLLTAERLAQLTAALQPATIPGDPDATPPVPDVTVDPIATVIAETEARIDGQIGGLAVDATVRDSLIRAFALHTAYALCGPVPKDIQGLYDDAKAELASLLESASPAEASTVPRSGAWGSATKIGLRA